MAEPNDLRDNPRYRDVWAFFEKALKPALGRLRNAMALAPAPDGATIVFVGPLYEKLEGRPVSRLGIVDVARGLARNLAGESDDVSSPRWSPDGAVLAYVTSSRRIAFICAGSATPSFASPGEENVEDLAWSSDSKRLLLRTAGRGAEASGAAGSGKLADAAAAQSGRPSWLPHVEGAFADDAWRRLHIIDAVTGEVAWTSPAGDNVWEAVWCGDGVLAIVSDDPSESSWYRSKLVRYDVSGDTKVELYRSVEEIGVPAASPDGRYATVIEACCSDRTLVAGDVLLFDLTVATPGPRKIDTHGVDVTHTAWRDAHRLFYIGLECMDTVAGEYDTRTGSARRVWQTAESVGTDYPVAWPVGDADGFVATVHSYGRYQRIVRVEGGAKSMLCNLGHDGTTFVERSGGRAELVTWTGRDGLEIDGILVLPAGDGPFPLVVNVHGGPVFSFRNEWEMHYYYVPIFAHAGYAVLNPNPRGSRGRGREFARKVRGDMCGEDTYDIIRGVEALIERRVVDPRRVAIIGRSYGGYMSSWAITQTDLFAAAIPMAPVTDNFSHHFTCNIAEFDRRFLSDSPYASNGAYAARSPVLFADRASTPTLSMAGARDRCTPSGQALEFHRALVENGVPSELVIYPEEGHHIDGLEARVDQMTRMLLWLERFMPSSQ